MKKIDKKTKGSVMAAAGFLMILVNAVNYFVSEETLPVMGIIGLVFVAVGLQWYRASA